ncbi:MAG: PAS domain-containing protein [Methylobacteriaceae bacterium]|nr:PAS domain-containing protein [Methylobacteriaceae bacterium]
MKQAATRELYSYWNGLRGERLSPERGEIDPAAIRGILADTFMLEVDAARRYPFRLSGTRLNALFMEDLKGRSFHALWARRDRDDIAELLASICDDAAAVVAGVTAAPPQRPHIELELLLLPVRHLGKTHARILGCLSPAKLASWMGLLAVECLAMQALRILRHSRRDADRLDALATSSGAEEAAVFRRQLGSTSEPKESLRRGHFFVHQRGR